MKEISDRNGLAGVRIISPLAAVVYFVGCGGDAVGIDHKDAGHDAAQTIPDMKSPAPPSVGAPCVQDSDCGAGRICFTDEATHFPSGYCSQGCSSDTECGQNSYCVNFLGSFICVAIC